jgi:probable rRNA maturation factor
MPDGRVAAGRGLADWLADIAPGQARGEVTVALVSDRRMRVLNRTFRGKDYATDVLSFAAGSRETGDGSGETGVGSRKALDPASLGDIVIAVGVANRQAKEHGHTTGVELKVLALHGLLHLIGYDHDAADDNGRMARTEGRLRTKAGLPTGLIARARGRAADFRRPTPDSRAPS